MFPAITKKSWDLTFRFFVFYYYISRRVCDGGGPYLLGEERDKYVTGDGPYSLRDKYVTGGGPYLLGEERDKYVTGMVPTHWGRRETSM